MDLIVFAIAVFVACAVLRVAVLLGGRFYGLMLEEKAGVARLRRRISICARMINRFTERLEERRNESASVTGKLFANQRKEAQLKLAAREMAAAPYVFVRVLGQERLPAIPFDFMAFNGSVSHMVKRGERHALYDSSWAYPLPVQVWAESLEDARHEFERVYPRTLGFKVANVQIAHLPEPEPEVPLDGQGQEHASDPHKDEDDAGAPPLERAS